MLNKNNHSDVATDILYTLLATTVIPGLIFLVINQFWFIDRAVFNIDYLWVCLILIPFGAVTVAIGMATILVLDIIFSFAPAYHFSLTSVLSSINDLFSLEPGFLVAEAAKVMLIVLLGTMSMYLVIRKTQSTKIVMVTSVICLILLVLLDMRFSANEMLERDSYTLNMNIAASSVNNLRRAIDMAGENTRIQTTRPAESASQDFRASLENANEDFQDIMLVAIESLGEFTNRELNEFQMEPIIALENHGGVALDTGVVAFEGSTVPGELRELCGIKLLAVHPDTSILPADKCLPKVLSGMGYRTWAIHGFIGTLFSRNRWYPALEFDNIWFAPELDEQLQKANRCGIAFHGICDIDIWKMIVELKSSEPLSRKFIYWLTLSAHLPVEHPSSLSSSACSQYQALSQNIELCNLVLKHRQLFSEIAMSAKRGELDNTRIILVGDHSPPFLDNNTRALFSSEHVPYIDIKISGTP